MGQGFVKKVLQSFFIICSIFMKERGGIDWDTMATLGHAELPDDEIINEARPSHIGAITPNTKPEDLLRTLHGEITTDPSTWEVIEGNQQPETDVISPPVKAVAGGKE